MTDGESKLYAAASRLAAEIGEAPDDVVRDLLAVAGADIFGALAALTQAIGAIVAERVDAETRVAVITAASVAITRAGLLRGLREDIG